MTTKDWLIVGGVIFFLMWRQGSINAVAPLANSTYTGKFQHGPVPPTQHPSTLQY